VTPKLYKAAEVCDMAQLQPYVLRSWEKEFPGIGVQKTQDGPRVYRQSDVDQVLRIKQLVFGEGLTLAGARRRLEDGSVVGSTRDDSVDSATQPRVAPAPPATHDAKASSRGAGSRASIDGDARARVAQVRDGLRSILTLLGGRPIARGAEGATAGRPGLVRPGDGERAEEYRLEPPAMPKVAKVRKLAAHRPASKRPVAKRRSARV
jgi:DNA-binding transcriptional MerR regulator